MYTPLLIPGLIGILVLAPAPDGAQKRRVFTRRESPIVILVAVQKDALDHVLWLNQHHPVAVVTPQVMSSFYARHLLQLRGLSANRCESASAVGVASQHG